MTESTTISAADAQGHTGQRHPGDEGHKKSVLARAHVAQAHKQ